MKVCAVISALCFISLVSALPVQNGMMYYQMPYYNPYHQAMLVHYAPPSYGRSAGTSAFAQGDVVAAGTIVKESRIPTYVAGTNSQSSSNDGNVEAIAEAYPEEPIQGTVQFDQVDEQYNDVIPLNAAPVSETPKEATEVAPQEPEITAVVSEEPQVQTTVAPKKKVHIALDIPEKHDNVEGDDEDDYVPYAPQNPNKPSKNQGGNPVYTFFPVSFGRAAGGTIAVANAYSTGKGAVRSHAIAYGASAGTSRRQQAAERSVAAPKSA
ncbi:uncharacterized protein LOC129578189 [Sitodiplosis mosellana]|uniref:uncharacterized protein LOC129578189 n=1 Tax=Sitodiplosis mosellana TaxID=263140 RepID=UPI002445325F|nr:uncharacterized protein LOC129578189 [Sitodiplosis mosellana]